MTNFNLPKFFFGKSSGQEPDGFSSGDRKIVNAVLIAGFLGAIALALININRNEMILLGMIFLLSLILMYHRYDITARWISLFSALVIISALLYKNYGIRDTAVMGLVVVLISAGLLAGRKGTFIIGTIILIEITILGYLESAGIIENKLSKFNNFSDYLTVSLTIFLITILQWLIINRLNKNILNAMQELNDRTNVEEKLRKAENRYRDLVEKIPAVIYISEPGEVGRWHYVSPQITELTGYTPEDWLNDPYLWYSKIHPDEQQKIIAIEKNALQTNTMPQMEYRLLTKSGKYIWIYDESLLVLESSTSQITVQGFLFDITARKTAEEQLQKRLAELNAVRGVSQSLIAKTNLLNFFEETGEQIRLAFNASNLFIAIHDPQTNLIHFPYDYEENKKHKDLPIKFGEGMTSKVLEMKKTLLINRDWANIAAQHNAIFRYEKTVKSSLAAPMIIRDKAIGIISMDNIEREDAFTENDVRLLETIAANLAVAIDNTYLQESLEQELTIQRKLISELETKNAELERFTYTASHDLKSPLITIRGYLGYLERDARSGNFERLQVDIQRISDATEKMHRLLSELLELSRVGRIINEPQEIPFTEIVNEALRRVEGQLTANQVAVEITHDLPVVYGDKERLVEVIQNLVDNSCKFMGEQKSPMIQIGMQIENDEDIFYVKDNGVGIKKQFHEKIFGLFDKLDSNTHGTGVGLALVKRIVEVHGGRIWVDSEENSGATFHFTLGKK
ncbi:MAG: PAS domain S-box protein [Anaerolineales bacterium]|nr:PAS domain S-box protein [Anaerolineales bacterium]